MDVVREPARKRRRLVSQFVNLEADAADDEEDEEGFEEEGEGEEEYEEDEDENLNGRFAIVTYSTLSHLTEQR